MDQGKRKRLEAAGWKVGDAADFLEMNDAERRELDLRAGLAGAIRRLRLSAGKSQSDLAGAIGSTQPRIARAEAAKAGVSLDLMFRAFFAAGGEMADLVPAATKAPGHGKAAAQRKTTAPGETVAGKPAPSRRKGRTKAEVK